MLQNAASLLNIPPNPAAFVLVFFTYSFLGYVMECVVLSIEHRRKVFNRGFVSHLPFCIIYGFGAMFGYALLSPFKSNLALLFVLGAVGATFFEYAVARMQIYLFGDFWWDYSHKRLNYKNMLCLESTLGWGVVGIVVVHLLHGVVVRATQIIPQSIAAPFAVLLVMVYAGDFVYSARAAMERRAAEQMEAPGIEFVPPPRSKKN